MRKELFEKGLELLLNRAWIEHKSNAIISAKELHTLVGGYPGPNHNMPGCCSVMKKHMSDNDIIINSPPSGNGASLEIKYFKPNHTD